MVKAITFGQVIYLGSQVNIPSEFLQLIGPQTRKNAVIIYSPSSDLLRIFFTNISDIYKVEAKIASLSHEFLSSLGSFLGAHEITPLYTTGLCENECLYEGYFEIDPLKMPLEEFKKYFSNIPGISDVKIVHFKI
ncbi:MAG: hypothetical protein ACFFA5_01560 [Promethearchaeota archaeon]